MISIRQLLIAGWIILLLTVFLHHDNGTVQQTQARVDNRAQAVEIYQQK